MKPAPSQIPFPSTHEPLSKNLAGLLAGTSGEAELTLNRLLERTSGRSLYLLVIILCLPFLIPVSVPGLSTVLGGIIILLMLRQALGKPPRLPRFLGEKRLPLKVQKRVLGGSIRLLVTLEKWVRPRRTRWLSSRPAVLLNTLMIIILAGLLALPLPAPPFFFSNTVPSYAMVVLAASLMEEDGIAVWAGYALFLANLIFFGLIAGVIGEVLLKLWQGLGHAAGV
jgi:hypothetical protein